MPTSPDKLSIAKASIQASTKGDEPLAHLLRNVADGMFGPEPKGVSIEHWLAMPQVKESIRENHLLLMKKRDARADIMKRDADVLRGLDDDKTKDKSNDG